MTSFCFSPIQRASTAHASMTVIPVLLGLILMSAPLTASALPVANNAQIDTAVAQNAERNLDPQVAPAPASPFSTPPPASGVSNPPNAAGESASTIDNTAASTLANSMQPSNEQLTQANQTLLSHNAQLQQQVNNLETQVNVLVNERSGQLFLFGALSVALSLLLGFIIGWFIFGRRRDSW